ncbi:MAG: diaminopimelate epimerase [Clostridia bacterium]|nr:diaminopimelate epimerase [Clostridia bacterium]
MPRKFFKMQGCGNDYLFFDCRKEGIDDPNKLSVRLSDRRFGVGGDGIVLLLPSEVADAKMRIFNADGSEGAICGTALRCIGKILFDEKEQACYTVETNAGVRRVCAVSKDVFSVDMGKADFSPRSIPSLFPSEAVDMPFMGYRITCLSMGNPHAVIFDEPTGFPLQEVAEKIAGSGYFPQGVNVEVCKAEGEIRARVYERGSGETLSCGSGACAVANAAYATGRAGKDVSVRFPGGVVQIKLTEYGALLIGGAVKVFTGEITI